MRRASLYRLFGGKEGLFLAAVSHYAETRLRPVADALGPKGGLGQDLRAFYDWVVLLATADAQTPGCLISCVLVDAAATNRVLQAERDRRLKAMEIRIRQRLAADGGPGEGGLPRPSWRAGSYCGRVRDKALNSCIRWGRPRR